MLHFQVLSRLYCPRLTRPSLVTKTWKLHHRSYASVSQSCYDHRHLDNIKMSYLHSRTTTMSSLSLSFSNQHRLKHTNSSSHVDVEKKEFIELYFIKNISFLRVLCRFSKLSVLLFLFGAPVSLISMQAGMLSPSMGTNIMITLAGYATLFTAQSFFFSSRVIGKIMMSSDEETVKISHLSLFGLRRDVFCKPSDIVPVKEPRGGGFVGENLCRVNIRGYPKALFYLPHQGHIDTDHELIDLMLRGELSKTKHSRVL